MGDIDQALPRPIRQSGWAFPLLSFPRSYRTNPAAIWAIGLLLVLCCLDGEFALAESVVQNHEEGHDLPQEHSHHGSESGTSGWEGSKAGIAYSERNHHLAGFFVLLIGVSEMAPAIPFLSLARVRLLLPGSLVLMGALLLIWSDHEAWPIGALSFTQTFFGDEHEIVQHKTYGLLALLVGSIEVGRRIEQLSHRGWLVPLPLFAIIGGLMLFGHSHGAHPSAEKIALHHAVMGTLAVTAGLLRLASGWTPHFIGWPRSRWDVMWSGAILLIGLQLLFYFE